MNAIKVELNQYQKLFVDEVALTQQGFLRRCRMPSPARGRNQTLEVPACFGPGQGGSTALLLAALDCIEFPQKHALIVVRSFAIMQQSGGLMHRCSLKFGMAVKVGEQGKLGIKFNRYDSRWTFPNGSSLTFGFMENSKDRYKFQGMQLNFIGIDHVEQFDTEDFCYLRSRLTPGGVIASIWGDD